MIQPTPAVSDFVADAAAEAVAIAGQGCIRGVMWEAGVVKKHPSPQPPSVGAMTFSLSGVHVLVVDPEPPSVF